MAAPLVIFANPKRRRGAGHARRNPGPQGDAKLTRRTLMSRHVQAIAYIHVRDGQPYVHGFDDADISERNLKKGWLDLKELHDETNVEMHYDPRTETITIRGTNGQSLAALFHED